MRAGGRSRCPRHRSVDGRYRSQTREARPTTLSNSGQSTGTTSQSLGRGVPEDKHLLLPDRVLHRFRPGRPPLTLPARHRATQPPKSISSGPAPRSSAPTSPTSTLAGSARSFKEDHSLGQPLRQRLRASARFLCPYQGRSPKLHEYVDGMLINPHTPFRLNYIALWTTAEYLRAPDAYQPLSSWTEAAALLGGPGIIAAHSAHFLLPLVSLRPA